MAPVRAPLSHSAGQGAVWPRFGNEAAARRDGKLRVVAVRRVVGGTATSIEDALLRTDQAPGVSAIDTQPNVLALRVLR